MGARPERRDVVLNEIREKSRLYKVKATHLSNLLEEAEAFLRQLPGKVRTVTNFTINENYQLIFDKEEKGWCLQIHDGQSGNKIEVLQSSLYYKAQAARLLPELYETIVNRLDSMSEELDLGLEKLRELPFLDVQMERNPQLAFVELDDEDEQEETNTDQGPLFGKGYPDDEIPF